MNEEARAARAAYQRELYKKDPDRALKYSMNTWKRKAAKQLGLDYNDPANSNILEQKGRELRNERQRDYAKKNPDKIKATQERYWERKAARAKQESVGL